MQGGHCGSAAPADRPNVPRQIGRPMTNDRRMGLTRRISHSIIKHAWSSICITNTPIYQALMLKTAFSSIAPLRVVRPARVVPFRRSLIAAAAGSNSMVKATWSERTTAHFTWSSSSIVCVELHAYPMPILAPTGPNSTASCRWRRVGGKVTNSTASCRWRRVGGK